MKKTAILRGYGDYYGHVIKAEIIEIDEDSICVSVNGKVMCFDADTGFEDGQRILKTGYQLVLESISIEETSLCVTVDGVQEFGQVNP